MPFGQLVIGPPGSGKTTFVNGMGQFLAARGRRVARVNLDPANDALPYAPDVDVAELVDLGAVMEQLGLGPNGGLLYAMDYLAANLDWLDARLAPLLAANAYLLLDCPGQVELFTGQSGFKRVLDHLAALDCGLRLAAVQLVDAHLATDAGKYISALLLSLSTMLYLELPQVNVLSKIDLLPQYGELAFNLDFYTSGGDLTYLVAAMAGSGQAFSQRYLKLSAGLAELVQDFGLVAFTPLAIQDAASVERLLGQVDKANGAAYANLDRPPGLPVPPELLAAAGHSAAHDELDATLQERYIDAAAGGRRARGGRDGSGSPPRLGAAAAAAAAAVAAAGRWGGDELPNVMERGGGA